MGKLAIKEVPSSSNGLGLDQLLDICKNTSKDQCDGFKHDFYDP
jgi:hypothetical protein